MQHNNVLKSCYFAFRLQAGWKSFAGIIKIYARMHRWTFVTWLTFLHLQQRYVTRTQVAPKVRRSRPSYHICILATKKVLPMKHWLTGCQSNTSLTWRRDVRTSLVSGRTCITSRLKSTTRIKRILNSILMRRFSLLVSLLSMYLLYWHLKTDRVSDGNIRAQCLVYRGRFSVSFL